MIYNDLGSTGLQVSALSFGAAPLGNEYGAIDIGEGQRAVHHAIACGINYYDVAPYYGRTLAEERLGDALVGKRQDILLATKAGRHGDDPVTGFDFSAKGIEQSLEDSLRRLRTDYVDVLLAHDIEFAPVDVIINETLPAMRRLREAGKLRFIGMAAYPLQMLARIIDIVDVDVVLSYSRYNLFDTTLDDMLAPMALRRGVALLNASPLNMGLLTEAGPPDWHPAPQCVIECAQQIADYCRQQGTDISLLALQFTLANPYASSTLVGMSTEAEVTRNVGIMDIPPDPALLTEIHAMIEPVINLYWKEGLAENDDPNAVEQKLHRPVLDTEVTAE